MICAFWNSRGIAALGRKQYIDDTLVPLHVDYIGFQETKKENFSPSFLKGILGNRNFTWNHLPAVGSAGGVLVGVNNDCFDVISWEVKKFSDSVIAKIKSRDKIVRITTVYGSAYEDGKQAFISELHELFINWEGPALIGGDFNLVRSQEDKNNGKIDFKWVDKFNMWVDMWALVEIDITGRMYTWSNNQANLVMSRIDRVFCSTCFDLLFPLATIKALPRVGSDHIPIIWDSGVPTVRKNKSFKFEKWWSTRVDFRDVVAKPWNVDTRRRSALDAWQQKVRFLESLPGDGV